MTSQHAYRNNSIKSITYNSQNPKGIDTGKLVRTYTTYRPIEGKFGDMEVHERPTYAVKEGNNKKIKSNQINES